MPSTPAIDELYPEWDTQKHNYHNVRVICDQQGLTVDQKNVLCACIWQESQFKNSAVNKNRDSAGTVTSTDWGIAQVNDYFHIGHGKDFPSVEYVLGNPDMVVRWMVGIYKHSGNLNPWVSFSSGAYKHWLLPGSPMWALKT